MDLIADSLLLAATCGAMIYCYVLASRLRRFTTLEGGMGSAIAVLSAQVDEMTRALDQARGVSGETERRLSALTSRAEGLAVRLELMVAALHDLPAAEPGHGGRPAAAAAAVATAAQALSPAVPPAPASVSAPAPLVASRAGAPRSRSLRFARRRLGWSGEGAAG